VGVRGGWGRQEGCNAKKDGCMYVQKLVIVKYK
jgi:hypothetical protein